MSDKPLDSHRYQWDVGALSDALAITKDEVLEYFRDGRRMSFILERRLQSDFNGTLSRENEAWDMIDSEGRKWEVRSLTESLYFCPSYMVGSGRIFNRDGFIQKLDAIHGYIVGDIKLFPEVPCWTLSSELVRHWWESGTIPEKTSISRARFYQLLGLRDPR